MQGHRHVYKGAAVEFKQCFGIREGKLQMYHGKQQCGDGVCADVARGPIRVVCHSSGVTQWM